MVFTLYRCLTLYILPRMKWWAQSGCRSSPRSALHLLLWGPRGFCTPLPTQAAIFRHYISDNMFIAFFQWTQQRKKFSLVHFTPEFPLFSPSPPLSPSPSHILPFFLSLPFLFSFPSLPRLKKESGQSVKLRMNQWISSIVKYKAVDFSVLMTNDTRGCWCNQMTKQSC